MSEAVYEDDEFVAFYNVLRNAVGDLLHGEIGVEQDAVNYTLTRLDVVVASRTNKLTVVKAIEEKYPDAEFKPMIASDTLESGVFNLIVSLVVHHRNTVGDEVARARVIAYLESIISGLQDVTPTDTVDNKEDN